MTNIKKGSRVKYKNHEGVVFDFKWEGDKNDKLFQTMGRIMVGIQFDERWRYDIPHDRKMYFHYNEVKLIRVRVFTAEDPYGEENWDD